MTWRRTKKESRAAAGHEADVEAPAEAEPVVDPVIEPEAPPVPTTIFAPPVTAPDLSEVFALPRGKGLELLPAWFTERMASEGGCHGLLLRDHTLVVISLIGSVTRDASGELWINAMLDTGEMMNPALHSGPRPWERVLVAPTECGDCSIRASEIVMAFELSET